MRYSNVFGKSSSRIILGTTYFGEIISEEKAFEIMDAYRELGGTHLDTARLYSSGRAEEIVGRWLKERNATEMHVSTKGGFPHDEAPEHIRISSDELRDDLERSLSALQLDVIDFYWLHRDDENIPVGEIMETMNAFVSEGKIKRFGASNWTAARIEKAQMYADEHKMSRFSASQLRFNPACITIPPKGLVGMTPGEFSYYKDKGMPVAAYSSQAKGFFSKMDMYGESALSQKAKERYLSDINLEKLEVIRKLAAKYDCSVGAIICGAFCSFDNPEVFPIVGCSTVEQLRDSMSGGSIFLAEEEVRKVFKYITE